MRAPRQARYQAALRPDMYHFRGTLHFVRVDNIRRNSSFPSNKAQITANIPGTQFPITSFTNRNGNLYREPSTNSVNDPWVLRGQSQTVHASAALNKKKIPRVNRRVTPAGAEVLSKGVMFLVSRKFCTAVIVVSVARHDKANQNVPMRNLPRVARQIANGDGHKGSRSLRTSGIGPWQQPAESGETPTLPA